MAKHAMALGYFFLAVFCIFTSLQIGAPREPLFLVASLAGLIGLGFLVSACLTQLRAVPAQFRAVKNWFVEIVNQLRRERELSAFTEDRAAKPPLVE